MLSLFFFINVIVYGFFLVIGLSLSWFMMIIWSLCIHMLMRIFPPSASEIARNFDRVCWRRTWAPADKVARAVDHGWCFRNLGREKKIWLMFHQSHLLMGLQPITVVDCPISEELQEMGLVTWKCWEPPQKAYWFVIMFLHQNGHYHIFETSKSWLQCEAPQWC